MTESNRGDKSEYVVKQARDLRIGDEIVAVAKTAKHYDWRRYNHTVSERSSLVAVGAASDYRYKVRVKPLADSPRPYVLRDVAKAVPPPVSAQDSFYAWDTNPPGNHEEWPREYLGQWVDLTANDLYAERDKYRATAEVPSRAGKQASNYGPLGVDINGVNIAGQRVRVVVDLTLRPGEVQILQPKIDGVDVGLLQEMYLDRQRDVPLKGLYKAWQPTPKQREYLRAWWSVRVKQSTATPEPMRPERGRTRHQPNETPVLVDNSDP